MSDLKGSLPLLLTTTLIVSCGAGGYNSGSNPTIELRQLEENRELWLAAGVANYQFEFNDGSFWSNGNNAYLKIEVTGGKVSSVTYRDSGLPYQETRSGLAPRSIDALFDFIGEQIAQGTHAFDAEYDPVLGFPTSISWDPIPQAIDDEQHVSILSLHISE